MFNVALSQVTFDQVEQFCRTFPEGVRVEYKAEPVHISKIISSFANTVGGIWVIGVETDDANRARLPITGMPRRRGVEDQIVQSAQSGIYPVITPDVRVLDVPGKEDRIIVVVKVPQSIEAPHAIENSTRVYIRVAGTTPPYDLADIDHIEYLLKRRQQSEQWREELIGRAAARSPYRQLERRVRVVIAPTYPRGILIRHDELYERAQHLEALGVHHLHNFRLIHEAITKSQPQVDYHFEVSIQGIAFFEAPAELSGELPVYGERDRPPIPFVYPSHLLYPVASVLKTVVRIFQGAFTNLLIRYELFGWQGIGFLSKKTSELINPGATALQSRCVDAHVSASTNAILETLPEHTVEVLAEIGRQILWAFNYTSDDLQSVVYLALKDANLV